MIMENYVFIVYGDFDRGTDGWLGYNYSGSWTLKATKYGIQMTDDFYQSTYILPQIMEIFQKYL